MSQRRDHRSGLVATVAVAALLASPVAGLAAAVPPAGFDAIDAYVRSATDASALPGLSYAVVRDGQVVHMAAFGRPTAAAGR